MPSGIPAYIFEGIIEPDIQSGALVQKAGADKLRCSSYTLLDPNISLMSRCVMTHVLKLHHPAVPTACIVSLRMVRTTVWDETTCDVRNYAISCLTHFFVLQA